MTTINPAFYRTELGLASDGGWYLMRDGQIIEILQGNPDGITLTSVTVARDWATAALSMRGIDAGPWISGRDDLPEADSAYFVTEPQTDAVNGRAS